MWIFCNRLNFSASASKLLLLIVWFGWTIGRSTANFAWSIQFVRARVCLHVHMSVCVASFGWCKEDKRKEEECDDNDEDENNFGEKGTKKKKKVMEKTQKPRRRESEHNKKRCCFYFLVVGTVIHTGPPFDIYAWYASCYVFAFVFRSFFNQRFGSVKFLLLFFLRHLVYMYGW